MEYFVSHVDEHGFTHSIDNLVLAYDFESIGYSTVKKMIPDIQGLKEKHPGIDYYEKLDLNACRKYSFCKDYIHLDTGITLFFGAQIEKGFKDFSDPVIVLPLVKLEINPNKHAGKPVLDDLLKILQRITYEVRIIRIDYAIDIPLVPDDVQVFQTNKEIGLKKGTRYYGQRNKNGFTRIYDKAAEQGLDTPLTRVETVISYTKSTKNVSFEKVFYKSGEKLPEGVKLSNNDKVLLSLFARLRDNGIAYEDVLKTLEARKRRFIAERLTGMGYKRLEYRQDIVDDLLRKVMEKFDVTEMPEVGKENIEVDADGFCIIPDMDLPFD